MPSCATTRTQRFLARRTATREFLKAALALETSKLSNADRITTKLFEHDMRTSIGKEACEDHLWGVSSYENPVAQLNYLAREHKVVTVADGANLLSRYRVIPRVVNARIENPAAWSQGRLLRQRRVGQASAPNGRRAARQARERMGVGQACIATTTQLVQVVGGAVLSRSNGDCRQTN